MNVSRSFMLGLAVALLSEELVEWLPGEASAGTLAFAALAMPVPSLWASATGARLRRLAASRARPWPLLELALRLQPLTVPLAYFALIAGGGLGELITRVAPDSFTLRFALLLVPLLVLEASLRASERRVIAVLEAARFEHAVPLAPTFVGMTVFVVTAVLLFGVALDLIALDRGLEVFFQGTSTGATVGLLAMVFALAAVLPLLFRIVLPTSHKLPDRVAGEVWSAAAKLGFSPRSVLLLWTEHRVVNAALVGPLRWPRYLVLTDGILDYLDVHALRGVVAHEVGHARAGHPALLLIVFAVVPILLMHPLLTAELVGADPLLLVGVGAAIALAGFLALRALMHRFELEADQLSAEALGGAYPCIAALRRVGDLFPSQRGKPSFRHPSEEQRIRSLTAWDTYPSYRSAFLRRGRAVRRSVAALLVIAAAVSVWSHFQTAPMDRAVQRLYTGDFDGAAAALDGYTRDAEVTARVREEVEAARSLVPGGGAWFEIRDELADRAWARGLSALAEQGLQTTRALFALATVGGHDDPVRESAWRFAQAVADRDRERVARLAAHLLTLPGVPGELRAAAERI